MHPATHATRAISDTFYCHPEYGHWYGPARELAAPEAWRAVTWPKHRCPVSGWVSAVCHRHGRVLQRVISTDAGAVVECVA